MANETVNTARQIELVVAEVSTAFQEAAKLFPLLSKELNRSRLQVDASIEEINLQKEDTKIQLGLVEDRTSVGGSEFVASYQKLLELNKEEQELISEFENDVNRFFSLDKSVSAIIDLSEDIQVIALNSLIQASKSGQDGKGFSLLTQRLRAASNNLKSMAEQLQQSERTTQEYFVDYKSGLNEYTSFENIISKKLQELPTEISKLVEDYMDPFLESLDDIVSSYNSMKETLYKIMEAIQNQDIITQSYDQIKITLERIKAPASDKIEDVLDNAAFTEIVSDICYELVKSTGESVSRISQTIIVQMNILEGLVQRVSKNQDKVKKAGESSSIRNRILKRVDEVNKQTSDAETKKTQLAEQIESIHGSIASISKRIDSFTEYVGRFRPIILTAKIEVAKRDSLKGLKGTILDLENDITLLEENVANTKNVSSSVFAASEASAVALKTNSEKILAASEDVANTMTGIFKEVYESMGMMESLVSEFHVLSSEFSDVFDTIPGKIDNLIKMESTYISISQMFVELGKNAKNKKEKLLEQAGMASWNLHDDSLLELINKFTIFSHKELAGEISGITIENKESDEGDVLFF